MRDRQYPLYHEELEHDSCGVGAVVDLNAKATHRTVDQALCIVDAIGMDHTGNVIKRLRLDQNRTKLRIYCLFVVFSPTLCFIHFTE